MKVNTIEHYSELKIKLKSYIKDRKKLAVIDSAYEFANEKHHDLTPVKKDIH